MYDYTVPLFWPGPKQPCPEYNAVIIRRSEKVRTVKRKQNNNNNNKQLKFKSEKTHFYRYTYVVLYVGIPTHNTNIILLRSIRGRFSIGEHGNKSIKLNMH